MLGYSLHLPDLPTPLFKLRSPSLWSVLVQNTDFLLDFDKDEFRGWRKIGVEEAPLSKQYVCWAEAWKTSCCTRLDSVVPGRFCQGHGEVEGLRGRQGTVMAGYRGAVPEHEDLLQSPLTQVPVYALPCLLWCAAGTVTFSHPLSYSHLLCTTCWDFLPRPDSRWVRSQEASAGLKSCFSQKNQRKIF